MSLWPLPEPRGFVTAWQFLTRFPSPGRWDAVSSTPGSAVAWFPAVGGILGCILLLLDQVALHWFSQSVVNALLVTAWVAMTGALHLDGLIDTVDGLRGGADAATRLRAMRQSAVGGMGALVGALAVLAYFVALDPLQGSARSAALILAPTYGRAAILLAYWRYPYGRDEPTLSQGLKAGANGPALIFGLVTVAVIALLVAGPSGLAFFPVAIGLVAIVARVAMARIPGLTGDCYGAICELTQLAVLMLAPGVFAVCRVGSDAMGGW